MFSRDISHARPTPRSLQTSKFGPYARLDVPMRRTRRRTVGYCLLLACAIVFASLVLAGCDNQKLQFSSNLRLMRDTETGCWYVKPDGYGGITPRLGADGRPMCTKEAP